MTDAPAPVLSVVVPTFNRRPRLHRVLSALAGQTTAAAFEVVVVSDGSTDGTDDYLSSDEVPLPVIAVSQANAGPAAARNTGVKTARGDLVLFLDDDVVPAPDLVEQHLRRHAADDGSLVVIGPMLNPDDAVLSPWVVWEQHQLYKQYDAIRDRVYECSFRQFYTGNVSLPRQRVIDVGLFDTKFRRAEDVELAYRLHEDGLHFAFAAEARGFHYAERSFDSWLATAFEYGRHDVAFMTAGHKWVSTSLPSEFARRNPLVRWLTRFGVSRPKAAERVSTLLSRIGRMQWVGPTARRHALSGLYNLTYYRGVTDALGSPERFFEFMDSPEASGPHTAFVLEQSLGHVTHSNNLHVLLGESDTLQPSFIDVPFGVTKLSGKIPGWNNWTVRAGVRASRAIRRLSHADLIDVMFIHTQVTAVLAHRWMKRIPTVVSLDATPLQYDALGIQYAHDVSSPLMERWKRWANMRCFRTAQHLVSWSDWARESLVNDYGVAEGKITVIPPGVHVDLWESAGRTRPTTGPVRILFVGGNFDRKGGPLLVEAARRLCDDPSVPAFEVHVATTADIDEQPGIIVHRNLAPNSAELIDLYYRCHIFCLPTFGDCLPMVLSEAGITGLALLSTDVGAIHEIVRHEETGLLIPPGDIDALEAGLRRLIADPDLRERLGQASAELVRRDFDARINADRLAEMLAHLAEASSQS